MKVAVCDDDKIVRKQIVTLIKEQEPDSEIIIFKSGEDMIKSQIDFDISFLDIEMNELSGIYGGCF